MIDEEKIFVILRKFDMAWSANLKMRFCDLYKLVTEDKHLTDSQLLNRLTEYIEKNNIKQ